MIWHLRHDMKRFRRITSGHCVLMGRKTFEALGKPLPKRANLVVTRQSGYHPEGTAVFGDLEKAIRFAEVSGEDELFVIGGGQIYAAMIERADRIYLTRVLAEPEGDAWFPEVEEEEWLVNFEEAHKADEQNDHAFIYLDLERKTPRSDD